MTLNFDQLFKKGLEALGGLVEMALNTEIDSLFAHNSSPEAIEVAIQNWLLHTPYGMLIMTGLTLTGAMDEIRKIIKNRSNDKAKAELKKWVHGRLHSREVLAKERAGKK